jgi:hypothetical protein
VCPIGRRFHVDRQFASPHGPSWERACSRRHWYIQRGYGACQSAFASKLPPTVDRVDRGIFGWLRIWRCGGSRLKPLLLGLWWRGCWGVPDRRPISCRSTICRPTRFIVGGSLLAKTLVHPKGIWGLSISLREQAPSHSRPVDGRTFVRLGLGELPHSQRQQPSHFHQVSQGAGFHLAHDFAAVCLDGDFTDAKVRGDDFV